MANHAEPDAMDGASSSQTSFSSASAAREAAPMTTGSIGQGEVATQGAAGPLGPHPAYHGRTVSWVAVSIIMVGFLVGGLALVFGTIWWLFWVGTAIAVVGLLVSLATNTFQDWY
jgi:hypothetical protein